MCTEFEWNNDTKCRTHQKPYYYYNKFFAHSLLVSRRQWFQCVSLFKRWGHSMPLTAFVGRIQTAHSTLSSRTGEQKSRCVHAVNETKRPDNQMNDVKRRNFNRGTFIMYIKTMRTNLKLTNFQRNWHNIIRLKWVYIWLKICCEKRARPTTKQTDARVSPIAVVSGCDGDDDYDGAFTMVVLFTLNELNENAYDPHSEKRFSILFQHNQLSHSNACIFQTLLQHFKLLTETCREIRIR